MSVKIKNNLNEMNLEQMGSRYPSRLSFSRSMLRKLIFDNWKIFKSIFDLDDDGFGTAVYEIKAGKEIYSLVCFSQFLADKDRSDRVIASKWDTAYTLHRGRINDEELSRLKKNIPLQESGRNSPNEIVLSRANKSVRLFQYVVDCLANGKQPDIKEINKVGYLLRTTAVYGSGKFGLSDFVNLKNNTIFNQPFRAEMLAVYLIREFSIDLVEHLALKKNPNNATKLKKEIKQHLGIGNATGLGMAPFIVKHPKLISKWMKQFNKTLELINKFKIEINLMNKYLNLLKKAHQYLIEVQPTDKLQIKKNLLTISDLNKFINYCDLLKEKKLINIKWKQILEFAYNNYNLDTYEIAKVQLIEIYPKVSENLANDMSEDENMEIEVTQKLRDLKNIILKNYDWAININFNDKINSYLFWYISQAKLEPRLGERYNEYGGEREQHLGIAKMVKELYDDIKDQNLDLSVSEYLLSNANFRGIVKRIQSLSNYPHAEIRDNILHKNTHPIDMLRFKLSFFGANRYDPKSDRWLRVTFFSGAPYLSDLSQKNVDSWGFATKNSYN
tara:strand:+ start:3153 stop:4826 length:1674 start_codon:yes stop_codon:yes gene_type:complete